MFDRFRQWLSAGTAGTAPAPMPSALRARAELKQRPPHEAAATGSPRVLDWDPGDVSANAAAADAPTIRRRCRDAVRNDSWARAIVETAVDDVIGWGVKPMSRATSEPFRQALQRVHDDWAAVADADGVMDLAGLQALVVRNWLVDGECFIRLRKRKTEDGLPVPLQIQVLPADICPDTTQKAPGSGNDIRQGIEYDAIGRRVAYWMYNTAPGSEYSDITNGDLKAHRVPAAEVLHVFEPLRPGQRRGVSALAPALIRLRELDKYTDATLLRLQIASLFVATLKKTAPEVQAFDPITGDRISETDPQGRPVLRMTPGTFQELDTNESLDFSKPPDPPVGFEAFVKHELRAAGAAVGVPLEAFTNDWGATNDRLARVVLNQYRRRVHRMLWSIVVPQFLRPLWNAWYDLAVMHTKELAGDLDHRVSFAPHAHAYVHPVQDVTSYREAIRAGLTSRQAVVAETGEDVEAIDAQIAADNARADRLKISVDSDGRQQNGRTA